MSLSGACRTLQGRPLPAAPAHSRTIQATQRAAAATQRRDPARARMQGGGVAAASVAAAASSGPSDVLVLDFDGVLCDSEREVSTSGYEACTQYWPHLFGGLSDEERQRVMAGMRQVRPRLIKGHEAMVMARLVLEDDSNIGRILDGDWEQLLEATLAGWGESHSALSTAFESHRSAQMSGNSERWVSLNPLYPGVADALKDCPYPFYIASSKAEHRLVALLRASLGMDIEAGSPRLFASLLPPNEKKIEALRTIMQRPVAQGGVTLHFVDDRYETLHAVVEQAPDLLDSWKLWLADWGYNTPEEREAAAKLPGVRLISRPQFCELLRWGVVMEVDDGCEPTPEEVEAAARS